MYSQNYKEFFQYSHKTKQKKMMEDVACTQLEHIRVTFNEKASAKGRHVAHK